MKTQIYSKTNLQSIGAYLFNFGMIAGLVTLTFGLVSCGGDESSPAGTINTTPTITSITPPGIVASSAAQTLTIYGTNFVSGVTVSVTSSTGTINNISPTSVKSTEIKVNVPIGTTAPTDNYATVQIKSSGTTLASIGLGVASTPPKTFAYIQNLFTTKCGGCHSSTTLDGSMDLTDLTLGDSTGVIGIPSAYCSSKFRVTPGDPRRTSSVLIDKIKATLGSPACSGVPMPKGASGPALLTTGEIQDIVDWVALGAN